MFNFIILRHISNKDNNLYWNICIDKIQNVYPNSKIFIIDDHSNYKPERFFTTYKKNNLTLFQNIEIINSELPPNRGELLPYYYLYKYKLSSKTIIIHDTVFIEKKIDNLEDNFNHYRLLWEFELDDKEQQGYLKPISKILKKFDNSKELLDILRNQKWKGCYGGMSLITLEFVEKIFNNHNYLKVLIEEIDCRLKRMYFERIISILFYYHNNQEKQNSLNGNIHKTLTWNTNYLQYCQKIDKYQMEKIWLSRVGNLKKR